MTLLAVHDRHAVFLPYFIMEGSDSQRDSGRQPSPLQPIILVANPTLPLPAIPFETTGVSITDRGPLVAPNKSTRRLAES